MLAIRLRRTGSKKRPFYRVVVADSRTARDSSFVEVLGFYNPRTNPETLNLKRDRLEHWLKAGAQPSDTIRTLVARMPPAPAPPKHRPLSLTCSSPHREPRARRRRGHRQDAGRSAGRCACDRAGAPGADADRAVHGARRSGPGHRTAGQDRRRTAHAGGGRRPSSRGPRSRSSSAIETESATRQAWLPASAGRMREAYETRATAAAVRLEPEATE